jgi:hypothetical protein
VSTRRRIAVAGVIALVWLGLAYCAGPPDAHGYRQTAVEAAQAGLNAARTVALAGSARNGDRLFDPYLTTVIDDEAGAVASALQRVTAETPPDDGTRRARDQLVPLLVQAAREIGDLDLAASRGDRAGVAAHVDRLREVGDRLDDFVERYR